MAGARTPARREEYTARRGCLVTKTPPKSQNENTGRLVVRWSITSRQTDYFGGAGWLTITSRAPAIAAPQQATDWRHLCNRDPRAPKRAPQATAQTNNQQQRQRRATRGAAGANKTSQHATRGAGCNRAKARRVVQFNQPHKFIFIHFIINNLKT